MDQLIQTIVPVCVGAFAAGCLIRGAVTGRMFCFLSLVMFGDARRKGNPAWFWAYGLLNLVIVLGSLLTFLGASRPST